MKTKITDDEWQRAVDSVIESPAEFVNGQEDLAVSERAALLLSLREQALKMISLVLEEIADGISARAWTEGTSAAMDTMLGEPIKDNPYAKRMTS